MGSAWSSCQGERRDLGAALSQAEGSAQTLQESWHCGHEDMEAPSVQNVLRPFPARGMLFMGSALQSTPRVIMRMDFISE